MKKLAERFIICLFASVIVIFSAVSISAAYCRGCDVWNWAGQGHWETVRTPTTLQGCEDNLANCEFEITTSGFINFYIVTRRWVYENSGNGGDAS